MVWKRSEETMKLNQVLAKYEASYRHNPDQFYPDSFNVETEGKQLVLVGVAKRHIRKRFRVVAILRPR